MISMCGGGSGRVTIPAGVRRSSHEGTQNHEGAQNNRADVVELADTQDLGSCPARGEGSSPSVRIEHISRLLGTLQCRVDCLAQHLVVMERSDSQRMLGNMLGPSSNWSYSAKSVCLHDAPSIRSNAWFPITTRC